MSIDALPEIMRTSGELVQEKHGTEWIAIQVADGMPNPIIMPIHTNDPNYTEWQREVRCFCVVSRKPEHQHVPFPEPPLQFPLPQDWQPIPIQTDCVFWYRDEHLIFSAVDLFLLSQQGSAIAEILRQFKQKRGEL